MTDLSANETETTDVVVVGGGLAGLTAAATAARAGHSVVVLDAHRLGGRAQVDELGGFLFNQGPRALYVDGAGRKVLTELGVATDRGGSPVLKGAMAMKERRLDLLPQGPGSLLRSGLLSPAEKMRFAQLLARFPRVEPGSFAGQSADEAIASFGLGATASELMRALVRLVSYAAATDEIDGPAAMQQLQMAFASGVVYLDGGWQTLVDGLAASAAAAGADVRTGVGVEEVVSERGSHVVVTRHGNPIRAGSVVVAAGGPDAMGSILGGRPAGWPTLGPPATVACLELALRRPPPTSFVLGVDEPVYLSTHCPPADLAPDGGAVVHAVRYRRHDENHSSQEAGEQLWDLARLAGIRDDDVVKGRFLANMVVTGALPTAAGGGIGGRAPVAVPGRPGVFIAGDWVGSEALLADAAIASGAAAGRLAVERSATLERA